MNVEINHLGKTLNSVFYDGNIDTELVNKIRNEFYNENKDLAIKQLQGVLNEGKSKNNYIYAYYFERIANDTVVDSKWSINQMLECDELIQTFHNKVMGSSEKVFPDKTKTMQNFKTVIRLGGSFISKKPTQFPIKVMRQILGEFTTENQLYYDPCMGWGMRMMIAAEYGLHYVGNDVNLDLMYKLKELKEDIQTIKPFKANLIYKGSEVFQPSLEGKVDFIFTSPPYFDLEVYKGSEYLREQNYDDWLELFMKTMLENCMRYLKNNKYCLINIKNTKGKMMYDDTVKIAEEIGFIFEGERDLKQANRTHETKKHGDSSEKIMVLKKQ